MSRSQFEASFVRLIDHEGGFQDDPRDKGNWTGGKCGAGVCKGTKFGISAARYPGLDIRNLTLEQAREIYWTDYWCKVGCEIAPEQIQHDLFDTAVNSGPDRALRFLQAAAGTVVDGQYGPATIAAVRNLNPYRLKARFHGHRLDFLNDNPTLWGTYGRGWTQRIAEILIAS